MEKSISETLAEIRTKMLEIRQQPKPEMYTESGHLINPEPWGGRTVYPIYPDNSYEQMLNRIEHEYTFDPS